jgi:putative transferase (TIGR04331 family)
MRRLNGEFPTLRADLERHLYSQVSVHKPALNRTLTFMKKQLASGLSAIGSKKRKIVYHNAYFPRSIQIQLLLRTKLRLAPFYYPNVDFQGMPCSREMRELIKEPSFGDNVFEKMLFDFISEEIPLIFVEGYRGTVDEIDRLYPFDPKAVMSATSWHYNDFFKLWAASRSEKGAILVGLQHGGGYGMT